MATALRVLVTGASGQLGSYVRECLNECADIDPVYLSGPNSGGPDLAYADSIRRVIAEVRPDAIVHLAGLVGGACEEDPERTRLVNVDAVGTLAMAAATAGTTQFVFASTAAVYGDQLADPVAEDGPTAGRSAYAASKLTAEGLLRDLALSGLHRTVLRIFNVYGDGFRGSLVTRLLGSTDEQPVILNGLDTFVRDYVLAIDVASAIEASLRFRQPEDFTVYNIGSGEPVSNRELVARLERRQPLHYVTRDGTPSYSCADITKARRELGFSPALLA